MFAAMRQCQIWRRRIYHSTRFGAAESDVEMFLYTYQALLPTCNAFEMLLLTYGRVSYVC